MNTKAIVQVKHFNLLGCDERGSTSDLSLPRMQSEFIYITRKAGTISGHSYHTGKNPGTRPKILLLLSGEIKFEYRKIGEIEKFSLNIKSPAQIEVSPNVAHAVHALTDIIILDCNSIVDIQEDRIKEQV